MKRILAAIAAAAACVHSGWAELKVHWVKLIWGQGSQVENINPPPLRSKGGSKALPPKEKP